MFGRRKRRSHDVGPTIDERSTLDRWLEGLPVDAMIHVKQNGVHIGTMCADHVGSDELILLNNLLNSPTYGPGRYVVVAHYQGSFRGPHIHVAVGRPGRHRRGSTRAETLDAVKRERMTPHERTMEEIAQLKLIYDTLVLGKKL